GRYNENGAPDSMFNGGRTQIGVGGEDTAVGLALQPGNQVLLAAKSNAGDDRLIRLTSEGLQDPTFAGGKVPLGVKALALAPDGKIVLGGWVLDDGTDACAVARFNADGSPDSGFGNGAPVLSRAVPNSPCAVEAAAIAPDAKIVAGEHTGEYPHERAAIVRYQVDPDPVAGAPGGNGGSGDSGGTTGASDGTAGGSNGAAGGGAGAQGSGAAPQTSSSAAPTHDPLTLSGLKVTNRRFTVNRAVTPRVGQAQAARGAKRGTAFAFALNRAATVAIRIDRVGKGRKARVVARLKRTAAAGGNRVSFSGHLGRRLLQVGSYRATFTAVDTTGDRTKRQAVKFRILRG
ncbi:MAG: delta-60 repeat domain-containing protein, partial [Solirubrobacteraceae bacterium]